MTGSEQQLPVRPTPKWIGSGYAPKNSDLRQYIAQLNRYTDAVKRQRDRYRDALSEIVFDEPSGGHCAKIARAALNV